MRRIILITIFFLFSLTMLPNVDTVYAEENKVPLLVELIYPDNQVQNVKGYFRLQVQPNQEQTAEIKLTNTTNKERKVIIQPANAYTNPVGEMLYSESIDSENSILLEDAILLTPSLHLEFNEVTLKPKEEKRIAIDITVPAHNEGTILGAVKFIIDGDTSEKSMNANEGQANFILKTETIYAIAIQLDLPNKTTPMFSLGEAGFKPNEPHVFIEMTNDAQLIQEDISGEYLVEDTSGTELFAGEIPSFKMAPKTQIQYPFKWGKENLEKGDYKLSVRLNVNNKEVIAENEFTIGNEEIKEFEEHTETTMPQGRSIPNWIWLITGAIVLSGFMFWLGRKGR